MKAYLFKINVETHYEDKDYPYIVIAKNEVIARLLINEEISKRDIHTNMYVKSVKEIEVSDGILFNGRKF